MKAFLASSPRLWNLLAVAALLVMEATYLSLWYQALFAPQGLSWAGVFALILLVPTASLLIVQGMAHQSLPRQSLARLPWNRQTRAAVFAAWLLLAVFASLKIVFFLGRPIRLPQLIGLPVQYILHPELGGAYFYHGIIVLLLAWRGLALAQKPASLSAAQGSFQLGLIFLLLYGMLFAPSYPQPAAFGLYLFLFCGLVAMSAARVANLSETRGGRIPRFGLGWMASILLSALALVGLAVAAGRLAGGQIVQVLSAVVIFIFAVLTGIVLLILSPLLLLMADLVPRLSDLLQQLINFLRNIPYSEQVARLMEGVISVLEKMVPYALAARGLFLAGLLIVLALGILLALYARGSRARAVVEEEQASRIEPGAEENPLQKLLRRLLRGARSMRGRRPGQLLAAARIRYIYRQLTVLSKKRGVERPASTTPLEFLPVLAGLFPAEDAALITREYLKIRYGEYPETRQEVEAVEMAWKRIRLTRSENPAFHRRAP